jgi:hypothetical protein
MCRIRIYSSIIVKSPYLTPDRIFLICDNVHYICYWSVLRENYVKISLTLFFYINLYFEINECESAFGHLVVHVSHVTAVDSAIGFKVTIKS